jgi:hypothetical protein
VELDRGADEIILVDRMFLSTRQGFTNTTILVSISAVTLLLLAMADVRVLLMLPIN